MDEKHFAYKRVMRWLERLQKLRASGRLLLKVCGAGAAVGLIIAFSIPREYTAGTFVAHEGTRSRNFAYLREMVGTSGVTSPSLLSDRDALYPSLYATIVKSTPFLLRLSEVEVRRQKDSTAMPLAHYMKEYQRRPWWKAVASAPFRLAGGFLSLFRGKPEKQEEKSVEAGQEELSPLRLTRAEASAVRAIASCIKVEIDQKKRAISLFVTMQDPLVAATVADTLQTHLREYMTEYRTNKSRKILAHNEQLCKEAEAEYHAAQERYARFADANRDLKRLALRAERSRLRSEMELARYAYNQAERQVQAAKARVERVAPVYTVIHPATVPLYPSKPDRLLILAGCLLLSGAGGIGWILFARDYLRGKRKRMYKPTTAQ